MTGASFQSPVDPARSNLMRRVRQRGTAAEDAIALLLRRLGIRYRRNVRTLPGSPDFANKSRKWAIFVNGCFWHRHEGCARATTPRRNREFWIAKFAANVARDQLKAAQLRALGFRVVIVWECEITDSKAMNRRLDRLSTPNTGKVGTLRNG